MRHQEDDRLVDPSLTTFMFTTHFRANSRPLGISLIDRLLTDDVRLIILGEGSSRFSHRKLVNHIRVHARARALPAKVRMP